MFHKFSIPGPTGRYVQITRPVDELHCFGFVYALAFEKYLMTLNNEKAAKTIKAI